MASKKKAHVQLVEKKDAPEPERIAESEMAYHAVVLQGLRQCETWDREIRERRALIERAVGARDSWMEHLASTYGLAEGDQVDEHGAIIRRGGGGG